MVGWKLIKHAEAKTIKACLTKFPLDAAASREDFQTALDQHGRDFADWNTKPKAKDQEITAKDEEIAAKCQEVAVKDKEIDRLKKGRPVDGSGWWRDTSGVQRPIQAMAGERTASGLNDDDMKRLVAIWL